MAKILFVSQNDLEKRACGVYLIGQRYYSAFVQYSKHAIYGSLASSMMEIISEIDAIDPDIVLVNYHILHTKWIIISVLQNMFPDIKFAKIEHDFTQDKINNYNYLHEQGYKYALCFDNTLTPNHKKVFCLNRMMAVGKPLPYHDSGITKIGYHGFAFFHKGIEDLAHYVCRNFENAVIRLHMPFSYYGDPNGMSALMMVNNVQNIIQYNKNITVEHSHELLNDNELIQWLSQNTINCYFYHPTKLYGVASAPDYAIAARRPIIVTPTEQLRYVYQNVPESNMENNSIQDIIANDFAPFKKLYKAMKPQNVVNEFDNIIDEIQRIIC